MTSARANCSLLPRESVVDKVEACAPPTMRRCRRGPPAWLDTLRFSLWSTQVLYQTTDRGELRSWCTQRGRYAFILQSGAWIIGFYSCRTNPTARTAERLVVGAGQVHPALGFADRLCRRSLQRILLIIGVVAPHRNAGLKQRILERAMTKP